MAIKQQFNSFEELLSGSELPVLVDFTPLGAVPAK
jgi:hypothetical protein